MRVQEAGGDIREFVEMVERHDRGLRALAYRLLDDREAMDDVLQDAYLKAFRSFSGFRGEAQPRTWLYRIVYNTCMDRLRSQRRRPEVSLEAMGEAGVGGGFKDDPGESVPRSSELAAAMSRLPADHRAAVLLVDAIGLTNAEAATVLGVRPGTIGSRLHYARSTLREVLSQGRD